MLTNLRYRQVHMDFHTSEHIPHVGNRFVAEEFADTLKQANVDSVTCFARCHHGWLYYPSKNRPDLIHPQLKNDRLLLEQIDACNKQDIQVPIYTTVQWDAYVMKHHPEWLAIDENGEYINSQGVPEPHFYYTICLNSDYRVYFKEHLQDIVDVVGVDNIDGFFMDILFKVDCNCSNCFKEMKKKELDTSSRRDRIYYSTLMLDEFKEEITNFIQERVPHAGIFYNSSHIGPNTKQSAAHYTHLELESLPSGGWGYDHFPATMRYARNLGKEVLGMTGKFHTYWGDFHSLKNKAALEFECFQMLALGAGCSIGDQLHPDGQLSQAAYDLIGDVYGRVKELEPYCKDTITISEIGVMTPEEFYVPGDHNLGIHPSLIGAVRLLQELSYQFDIIDSGMNFMDYKMIILPDVIEYSPELEEKLHAYMEQGGKVIGTHHSLMEKSGKTNNVYGNKYIQEGQFDRDFILPSDTLGKKLPKEEFVMYVKGTEVEPVQAEVLLDTVKPYFNREGDTFCSHQHAPSSREMGMPAATRNGNAVYFAHPIFGTYRKNSPAWCKAVMKDALEMLLSTPLVQHRGHAGLITSLAERKSDGAHVLHVLNYLTQKKSEDIYTIEDILPVYDVPFEVFVGGKQVNNLYFAPDMRSIPFEQVGESIRFEVPRLDGYAVIVIE